MKICVIGLGRFGYQVATALGENGMEVLAIDSNESIVDAIKDSVTQAICMRVRDETSLKNIGIEEMDTVVVAMGDDFAESVLITALLKKRLKTPHVVARAIDEIHKEILQLTGADEVILPEQEIGLRLASSLSLPFTELSCLSKSFSISQITTPTAFVGKTVASLDFFANYQSTCVGIRRDDDIQAIDGSYKIQDEDMLIFAGNNKGLAKLARLS